MSAEGAQQRPEEKPSQSVASLVEEHNTLTEEQRKALEEVSRIQKKFGSGSPSGWYGCTSKNPPVA